MEHFLISKIKSGQITVLMCRSAFSGSFCILGRAERVGCQQVGFWAPGESKSRRSWSQRHSVYRGKAGFDLGQPPKALHWRWVLGHWQRSRGADSTRSSGWIPGEASSVTRGSWRKTWRWTWNVIALNHALKFRFFIFTLRCFIRSEINEKEMKQ